MRKVIKIFKITNNGHKISDLLNNKIKKIIQQKIRIKILIL